MLAKAGMLTESTSAIDAYPSTMLVAYSSAEETIPDPTWSHGVFGSSGPLMPKTLASFPSPAWQTPGASLTALRTSSPVNSITRLVSIQYTPTWFKKSAAALKRLSALPSSEGTGFFSSYRIPWALTTSLSRGIKTLMSNSFSLMTGPFNALSYTSRKFVMSSLPHSLAQPRP